MKQIVLAMTILLLAGATVQAQPDGHDRKNMRKAMQELNLTDEQKDAMKDIRSSTQKAMIDLRAELQKKRIEMRDIHSDEQRDRAAFAKLSRDIADLQVKQKLLMFDSDEKILQQLDPEQQEAYKKMKKFRQMKRGKRASQGRGMRMGRPERSARDCG